MASEGLKALVVLNDETYYRQDIGLLHRALSYPLQEFSELIQTK